MSLDFAVEKAFKMGLYFSTLSILGAPTLAMMQTTFMTSEAISFQDAIVNEIQIVYAGKLQSVNENLLLPKNATAYMFSACANPITGFSPCASSIIVNVNTPLGSSGDMKEYFGSSSGVNITVYKSGGDDLPNVPSANPQCYKMTTTRDKSTAYIYARFDTKPCGS